MNLSRLIPSPGSQPLISNLLLYLLSPITQINIYEKASCISKNHWEKSDFYYTYYKGQALYLFFGLSLNHIPEMFMYDWVEKGS